MSYRLVVCHEATALVTLTLASDTDTGSCWGQLKLPCISSGKWLPKVLLSVNLARFKLNQFEKREEKVKEETRRRKNDDDDEEEEGGEEGGQDEGEEER